MSKKIALVEIDRHACFEISAKMNRALSAGFLGIHGFWSVAQVRHGESACGGLEYEAALLALNTYLVEGMY